MELAIKISLVLAGPVLLAWITGGAAWAWAQRGGRTLAEAGARFQTYPAFIWPLLILTYAGFLAFFEETGVRAAFSDLKFDWTMAGVAASIGLAAGVLGDMFARREEAKLDADAKAAFQSTRLSELPGFVVLVALGEELVFRIAAAAVFTDWSPVAVAITSSAAFALIHHSFWRITISFLAGNAFMTLYFAFDNPIAPILAHAIANLTIWVSMRLRS